VARKNKKVSKKKTSSRSKKGRRLTKADLNYFKKLLLEKRMEILSDVARIEDESLKKSRLDATGDLSNVPIHMADIGTDNFEQEFALDLMDSERKLLDEIHRALERIEDGTYGICESTGKPISKVRLKAKPWARYCIKYARMIEQGLVPEG
jgi:DnaK suppressor protein